MSFENKYPYTDFHELNLDWFLAEFKKVSNHVDTLQQNFDALNSHVDDLERLIEEYKEFILSYFDEHLQEAVSAQLDIWLSDGTIMNLLAPALYYVVPEYFGAKGDGVTDDTDAIQNAIDFCSDNSQPLYFYKKQYRVTRKGNYFDDFGNAVAYSLIIKSNLIIEGNGCYLINSDVDHASFFTNKDGHVENISINEMNFAMPNISQDYKTNENTIGLHLYDFSNVKITNSIFKTFYGRCIDVMAGDHFEARNIDMYDVKGHGLSVGKGSGSLDPYENAVKYANISNVKVFNQYAVTSSIPSNPVIATLVDSNVDNIVCENCAWGIKFENQCNNVMIDHVVFIGGVNNTANTGLKIQGDMVNNMIPKNITIGQVKVKDTTSGYSLYISGAENVVVNDVIAENCEKTVYIVGKNIVINNIETYNCKQTLYIYKYSTFSKNVTIMNIKMFRDSDYTDIPIIDLVGNTYYGRILQQCSNPTPGQSQRSITIDNTITDQNPYIKELCFDMGETPAFQLPVTVQIDKITGCSKDKTKYKATLTKNATSTTLSNVLSFNTAMTGGKRILTKPVSYPVTSGINVSNIVSGGGTIILTHDLTDPNDDTFVYIDIQNVIVY